jgi:hypothetical protein
MRRARAHDSLFIATAVQLAENRRLPSCYEHNACPCEGRLGDLNPSTEDARVVSARQQHVDVEHGAR